MMGSLDLSWAAEGQKKLFGESPAHSGLTCKGTRNPGAPERGLQSWYFPCK